MFRKLMEALEEIGSLTVPKPPTNPGAGMNSTDPPDVVLTEEVVVQALGKLNSASGILNSMCVPSG